MYNYKCSFIVYIFPSQAINYYEAALKSGQQSFLRYDLADLLMKLRQFERCEKVLQEALTHDPGEEQLSVIKHSGKEILFYISILNSKSAVSKRLMEIWACLDFVTDVWSGMKCVFKQ